MAARRKIRARDAQLAFEALSIEGGLLSPDWLSKVAQLQAGQQSESDYRIPKGLNVRDEMGRYWRIAQAHWADFAAGRKSNADPKLLATRFVTSLLREAFGYTSLTDTAPLVIADRSYPIGHAALNGHVPVVIAPAEAGLDTLAPALGDGGRRRSAFGLAQEFLNAQEGALWGVATDGVTLRIVRDNASLTRPAWIEADLGRIFAEERYADFAALWLLLHETRFGREGQAVTECPLENWRNAGREEGTRARDHLRRGVEEALIALGQGFLSHPGNATLRSELQNGTLTTKDYFNQLLRLVYRLIFLLTVEERGLLHPPETNDAVKSLYADGYGLRRLRERSLKRSAHDRFADLWEATKIVFRGVAAGEPRLGLPALAGIFAASQCPALDAAALENRWLLLAVFKLAWLHDEGALARVNWRDMGPEELGSVYESLLELVPQITENGRQVAFATGGETKGNARKTTGSYYTPDSLVQVLLDSALEPVIADTIARNPSDPIEALLGLSIVDPACGSGHFLLAASRRLAAHVARLQANGTPSAAEYRHALRQVVGRCIYGVDLNPMAVELCKVSLWMEAVEPGLPLTFLNSHIQHGNALLGTTPELMANGIPDKAWDPIEGDEVAVANSLKRRNKAESAGQRSLNFALTDQAGTQQKAVVEAVEALEATSDASLEGLAVKEQRWSGILESHEYQHQRFVADTWCAAFVWPKRSGDFDRAAPTTEQWRELRKGAGSASALTLSVVRELAERYAFFHWHLQFPSIFASGGFDVVLGNPPWEMPETDDRVVLRDIAVNIAEEPLPEKRRELLQALRRDDPISWTKWQTRVRENAGTRHLLVSSNRFPDSACGRLNYCRTFIDHSLAIADPRGRAGLVVQSGFWNARYDSQLWTRLVRSRSVVSIFDFENRSKAFSAVDSRARYTLLSLSRSPVDTFDVAFWLRSVDELRDARRVQTLSLALLQKLDPESLTIPQVHGADDLRLLLDALARLKVFGESELFPHTLRLMFSSSDDVYQVREYQSIDDERLARINPEVDPEWLPVYEGKMIGVLDHRQADIVVNPANVSRPAQERIIAESEKRRPDRLARPQYWIRSSAVRARRLGEKMGQGDWELVFCDVTAATNERTAIPAIVPLSGLNRSLPAIYLAAPDARRACILAGMISTFAFDYFARLRVTTNHLTQGILESLPVVGTLAQSSLEEQLLLSRAFELSYTAWDLEPFARDVGYDGPPFRWNPERRFMLRCELDAAFFHLYGLSRNDTDYVMDTFPIVRKNDEKAHGEYRTKRVILEIYDAMAEATRTSQPYQTRLDPPPADARVAHPPRGAEVIPLVSPPLPSQPDRYRELPAWSPDLLPAVAESTGLHLDGSWASHLSGYDLGFSALAAVLRNLPGPSSREEVERAVVLALLPRLMQSKFEGKSAGMWRRLVGADIALTSIASLAIPWSQILGLAVNQHVLEIVAGRWSPGSDVQDAPSPALDARAVVSLSWLVDASAEDQELNDQLEVLNVA